MQFAVIFKHSFFVMAAGMLLSSKVLGKHFKAEQLFDNVDPTSSEANPTLNPDVNATSIFRRKRDASNDINYLKDCCPSRQLLTPQQMGSRNPCIAESYICLGYVETVCRDFSFACLQSIQKVGLPKCSPDYEVLSINLGAKGHRTVRWTKSCHCA